MKKEQLIQQERGPGYKSKDEFKAYANELREKTALYKKLKDELKAL
jgi:intraflagellar transport protein 81